MTESLERRSVYDDMALNYDRARPGYPEALFDDIVRYAGLRDDARLLEIGCGTGQATAPMARRGYDIECIELGPRLAAIAGDKVAAFSKVKVIRADFESITRPPASYDLLLSATAFHWIDSRIRFQQAHNLLKRRGALALFWHRPAQSKLSSRYFEPLQRIYQRVSPELATGYRPPPPPNEVATEYDESIEASGFFLDLKIKKHYVATDYRAKDYIRLLDTFSDHHALPAAERQRLFTEIEELINLEFAGKITRETVALLYLARRK